ncbi:hypothetical protein FocTR4_00006904, partial [Fusarium oxysporum f. sp. cubense]
PESCYPLIYRHCLVCTRYSFLLFLNAKGPIIMRRMAFTTVAYTERWLYHSGCASGPCIVEQPASLGRPYYPNSIIVTKGVTPGSGPLISLLGLDRRGTYCRLFLKRQDSQSRDR